MVVVGVVSPMPRILAEQNKNKYSENRPVPGMVARQFYGLVALVCAVRRRCFYSGRGIMGDNSGRDIGVVL